MQRENVERIIWKVLSRLEPRPDAEDVDLIMAAVDAYAAVVRRGRRPGHAVVHYAPMPATTTACGVINAGSGRLRLTGQPADTECENCKATERWRDDMTVEKARYG